MNEELISHWMDIASAIFYAEDKIKDEWFPRLHEAKKLPPDEKPKLVDEYLRAIAIEILSNQPTCE